TKSYAVLFPPQEASGGRTDRRARGAEGLKRSSPGAHTSTGEPSIQGRGSVPLRLSPTARARRSGMARSAYPAAGDTSSRHVGRDGRGVARLPQRLGEAPRCGQRVPRARPRAGAGALRVPWTRQGQRAGGRADAGEGAGVFHIHDGRVTPCSSSTETAT